MANTEHLAVIQRGPTAWNRWRKQRPAIRLDLSGANLAGANLAGANLSYAYVSGGRLNADLSNVYLSSADLRRADLSGADLRRANLSGGDLIEANFSGANLTGANLSGANLVEVDLCEVDLARALFTEAVIGWTIFADVDLRTVRGLETVIHQAPSTIGTDTIARSEGHIPEGFLRGAGLPDPLIASVRVLQRSPMAYAPCFISYSIQDQDFVERLCADLQSRGIRCWPVREGMKVRSRIDNATRLFDTLLLVLSEYVVESAWVEKEVETARDREARTNAPVLFPLRLDEAVMQAEQAWAVALRGRQNIGDFCQWKQPGHYQRAFTRLLHDLKPDELPSSDLS